MPAERYAAAYAPGHVTGVFVPQASARDPRARGSIGAGLVLGAGVTAVAEWRPADRRSATVRGPRNEPLPISTEVAHRLLHRYPGALRVDLRHDLPIGQGFGMSAAGALATALAVGSLVGARRTRAVEIAHLADLFGGGGLGGVAAILGGGFEVRVRPGIPPFGRTVRRACRSPVLVGVVDGPVPSPDILGNPRWLARIRRSARGLEELQRSPTLDRFWKASEEFTDRVGLARPRLRDVIDGLRRRGARAAQAMFGGCFFAELPGGPRRAEVLDWLRQRRIAAVELPVDLRGARLLPAARIP